MGETFRQVLDEATRLASSDFEYARQWFFGKLIELPAEERLNNLYKIQAKDGRAVRFRMNREQRRYWSIHKNQHHSLILKSRQEGFTTFACVRAYDKALFEAGSRCGIMAHKQPNVMEIFKIVRRLHDWFVEDWGQWFPIETTTDSRTEIGLSCVNLPTPYPLSSSIKVSYDFKGFTLNFLHISEAAFIDKLRITEALQCVPHSGWAVWETTPNGMGGAFYDTYQQAKKCEGAYKRFFAPWTNFYPEDDDPVTDEGFNGIYTAAEMELKRLFDASDRAIVWRRNKVAELGGDENEFERLYPSDEDRCFLSGEAQVFPAYLLNALMKKAAEPRIGELNDKGGHIQFTDDAAGRFLMWEEAKTGHFYVVGMDTSEGVGQDATVAYVKDRTSGKFVACLYGQLEVDEAAECAIKLCRYYNHAFICPEINNHGHAVVENMKRRNWSKFYKRRRVDNVSGQSGFTIGFSTTKDEKHRIIQNFKTALRNGTARPQDGLLIKEMSTFICSDGGRLCAQSNCHDDRVMAAALTEEMDAALPPPQDELNVVPKMEYDPITGFVL